MEVTMVMCVFVDLRCEGGWGLNYTVWRKPE